jgi:hypothetical protein
MSFITTSITLEDRIIQATATGQSYTITFDLYELPGDFLKLYLMLQRDTPSEIRSTNNQFEINEFLLYDNFSGVVDRVDLDYKARETHFASQGTIAVTNGSATIEGTSTQFVTDQLNVGDFIRIDTNDRLFQIASITDLDTLVLTETYPGTTASSLTYAVRPAGTRRFRLFDFPDDNSFAYLEYKRSIQPMVADTDTPDPIPVEFHYSVILKLALVQALQPIGDEAGKRPESQQERDSDSPLRWRAIW